MAKLVNVQTKLKITAGDAKDATSFALLAEFLKQMPAQGIEQFWARYEILKALANVAVGAEWEFTAAQGKEIKDLLNQRRWPIDADWAELIESFKPVL